MNIWKALTDIVKAFIESGSPGYAFGTVCIIGMPPVLVTGGVMLLRLLH